MSDIQGLGQYISAIVRDSTSSLQQMNEIAKRLQTSINEAQRLMQGTAQSSFQQLMGQLNAAVQHLTSAAPFVEQAAATGKTWVQTHVSGASGGSASGGGSSDGGSSPIAGAAATSAGFGSVLDSVKNVIKAIFSPGDSANTVQLNYDPNQDAHTAIKDNLQNNGIESCPIQPINGERTREEIINRLGGGDLTKGSCNSLAFAYIGNIAGYDVLDFRGGKSRLFFSARETIERIAKLPGVVSFIERGGNDVDAVLSLENRMIENKEYYLGSGKHAAIIRKKNAYEYEYLELQRSKSNGWRTLSYDALVDRFKCRYMNTDTMRDSYLIDVDSLAQSQEFLDILRFINTAETNQHKGVKGNVK